MSENKTAFSSDNLNEYLKELAKAYKKQSHTPAEIILVGGAAILANYGFREKTFDVDAVVKASSVMKDAANQVGDKYNLPEGWFNSDFKTTTSYTPRLSQFSKHYRTFSNIVDFRTITGEHLVAMKLMAGRDYKHDLSDAAEIIAEHQKNGNPISYETVLKAITDLYDDVSRLPEKSANFLLDIYGTQDLPKLIEERKKYEADSKALLEAFNGEYKGVLKEDNTEEILASLIAKSKSGVDYTDD